MGPLQQLKAIIATWTPGAPVRMSDCKAIIAAVNALDAPGWQPIETAPNGQRLILFFPADKSGRMMLGEFVAVDRYPVSYPRQPTHWMPLPAAPEVL